MLGLGKGHVCYNNKTLIHGGGTVLSKSHKNSNNNRFLPIAYLISGDLVTLTAAISSKKPSFPLACTSRAIISKLFKSPDVYIYITL